MRRTHYLCTTAIALSVFSSLSIATPVLAQGASNNDAVAEVVVTARKREERLLDVPITVQAFSEEALRASGTFDLQDLRTQAQFNFVKSLGTSAAGRTFGNLSFRGLQGEGGMYYEASGSAFVDGIYISGGIQSLNTIDVERVEVLKGPQSAFFGRSTFGGAVNLITKKPADKFQGSVNASATDLDSHDFDATVEGPLLPGKLNGRLTILDHDKAAQYTASDGGELGGEKTRSATLTLYATPTDGVWVRLRGSYQRDSDTAAALGYLSGSDFAGNPAYSCTGKTFAGQAVDITGAPVTYSPRQAYFCGKIPSLKEARAILGPLGFQPIDANTDIPLVFRAPLLTGMTSTGLEPFYRKAPRIDHAGMERETIRLSAQTGVELPYNANFILNVGYNNSDSNSLYDLDRSNYKNYFNTITVLTKDYTIDARLQSDQKKHLRGLVGLTYFESVYQNGAMDLNGASAPLSMINYNPAATVIRSGNYQNAESEVPAVYGSIEYDIFDPLTLTLEGRYQTDQIRSTNAAGSVSVDKSKKFLPRVSLSFKPSRNLNIYATYSEGIQPRSINAGYTAASAAGRALITSTLGGVGEFSPITTLDSYELGIKQRLFDGRIEYAAAIYYEDWTNRITTANIFNPTSCPPTPPALQTPACPFTNTGASVQFGNDARVKGAELNLTANITSHWSGNLALEYNDAVIPRYYAPGQRNTLGNNTTPGGNPAITYFNREVGKQPKLSGALASTYRDSINETWDWYVRGDVTYTGKQWEGDYNFAKTDAFFRVNARVGMEKDDLTLELFVKNLFDDEHWDNSSRLADTRLDPVQFAQQGVAVAAPDRREFGLRAGYKF